MKKKDNPLITRKEFKKKFGMTPLQFSRYLRQRNGERLKKSGII